MDEGTDGNDDPRAQPTEVTAAGGLRAVVTAEGVRIGYDGHDDWFGPGEIVVSKW